MKLRSLLLLLRFGFWLGAASASFQEDNENFVYLRYGIDCVNSKGVYEKKLYSKYWTLLNYLPAGHGPLLCSTSVTLTTHGDYSLLDNVGPLAQRWQAPISVAVYAPGRDFEPTIRSILWLRQCAPDRKLINHWVNFHVYFHVNNVPKNVYSQEKLLQMKLKCQNVPPFARVHKSGLYLDYPISVGRNIARKAAQTHFVLASDIELYPSAGLHDGFLQLIYSNIELLRSDDPIIFPLNIFEVARNATVPSNKDLLQQQLANGEAFPFHGKNCPRCNLHPQLAEWINNIKSFYGVTVFEVIDQLNIWDPVYIGTIHDPPFDERLTWKGRHNNALHSFALCLKGYKFYKLDNAFLVHRGIRRAKEDPNRWQSSVKHKRVKRDALVQEYQQRYGVNENCVL